MSEKACRKCAYPVVVYRTGSGHRRDCVVQKAWVDSHRVKSLADLGKAGIKGRE